MSNKHNKSVAPKTEALNAAVVTPQTTNEVVAETPKVEVVKVVSKEDTLTVALVTLVTGIATDKLADRGELKVVDLESAKYEALFATVGANGCGFKKFGKVTNFPAGGDIVSDATMYRKMQKLNVPVGGGEIRYHGNLIRWFEGDKLTVAQLDELMKTRPEKVKPVAPAEVTK